MMPKTDVLLSIRPEWCELIRSGEKKTELRRSKPTLPTPFKCYIYCTKPKKESDSFWIVNKPREGAIEERFYGNGSIIGEFICDDIGQFELLENGNIRDWHSSGADLSCVAYEDAAEYIKNAAFGYAWHISNLIMYNKPKALNDFKLFAAPQSWRYVTNAE